jgi:hypothetical protein
MREHGWVAHACLGEPRPPALRRARSLRACRAGRPPQRARAVARPRARARGERAVPPSIPLTAAAPRRQARAARSRRHRPDFSATFQHLALHPGALPVMRKVAQALRFSAAACQPSTATLERYGNTSCSSTLYVLAHIEHHQGVRRGEKARAHAPALRAAAGGVR